MNFSLKKRQNKKESKRVGCLPALLFLYRKWRCISYKAKKRSAWMRTRAKKKFVASRPAAGGESCGAGFCFYALELVLYMWFLAEDALNQTWLLPSDTVKYISICLCAAFAWVQYGRLCRKGNADRIWMPLAQVLILPADWILLFHNEWTAIGIGFFLAVQVCYGIRLMQRERQDTGKTMREIICWYVVCTLGLIGFLLLFEEWLIRDLEPVVLLGLVYGALFVHHIILAVRQLVRGPEKQTVLFAVGLILFFLCDVHVAYWFGTCQGMFVGAAQRYGEAFAWFAMWLFYLPGQMLLMRSNWYPVEN